TGIGHRGLVEHIVAVIMLVYRLTQVGYTLGHRRGCCHIVPSCLPGKNPTSPRGASRKARLLQAFIQAVKLLINDRVRRFTYRLALIIEKLATQGFSKMLAKYCHLAKSFLTCHAI